MSSSSHYQNRDFRDPGLLDIWIFVVRHARERSWAMPEQLHRPDTHSTRYKHGMVSERSAFGNNVALGALMNKVAVWFSCNVISCSNPRWTMDTPGPGCRVASTSLQDRPEKRTRVQLLGRPLWVLGSVP